MELHRNNTETIKRTYSIAMQQKIIKYLYTYKENMLFENYGFYISISTCNKAIIGDGITVVKPKGNQVTFWCH